MEPLRIWVSTHNGPRRPWHHPRELQSKTPFWGNWRVVSGLFRVPGSFYYIWIKLYDTYDFSVGQTQFAQGKTLKLYPKARSQNQNNILGALGQGAWAPGPRGPGPWAKGPGSQAEHDNYIQISIHDFILGQTRPGPGQAI